MTNDEFLLRSQIVTSKMEVQMAKKEQERTTDMIPVVAEPKDIKSLIYVVRGQQVMLDSDLAMLYQVETKIFNQAVSRTENSLKKIIRRGIKKVHSESGVCELYSVDNRTNDGILSVDSDKEDR